MYTFTLYEMITEFYSNKDVIKNSLKESYDSDDKIDEKIMSLSIKKFLVLLTINLLLFVAAIALLVINWKKLNDFVKISSVILLVIIPYPILVILLVLFNVVILNKNSVESALKNSFTGAYIDPSSEKVLTGDLVHKLNESSKPVDMKKYTEMVIPTWDDNKHNYGKKDLNKSRDWTDWG